MKTKKTRYIQKTTKKIRNKNGHKIIIASYNMVSSLIDENTIATTRIFDARIKRTKQTIFNFAKNDLKPKSYWLRVKKNEQRQYNSELDNKQMYV